MGIKQKISELGYALFCIDLGLVDEARISLKNSKFSFLEPFLMNKAYRNGIERCLKDAEERSERVSLMHDIDRPGLFLWESDAISFGEKCMDYLFRKANEYAEKIGYEIPMEKIGTIYYKAYEKIRDKAGEFLYLYSQKTVNAKNGSNKRNGEKYEFLKEYYAKIWKKYHEKRKALKNYMNKK